MTSTLVYEARRDERPGRPDAVRGRCARRWRRRRGSGPISPTTRPNSACRRAASPSSASCGRSTAGRAANDSTRSDRGRRGRRRAVGRRLRPVVQAGARPARAAGRRAGAGRRAARLPPPRPRRRRRRPARVSRRACSLSGVWPHWWSRIATRLAWRCPGDDRNDAMRCLDERPGQSGPAVAAVQPSSHRPRPAASGQPPHYGPPPGCPQAPPVTATPPVRPAAGRRTAAATAVYTPPPEPPADPPAGEPPTDQAPADEAAPDDVATDQRATDKPL